MTDVLDQDPDYRAAVVDLLGVLALGELMAFERLAEDAKLAPGITDKAELAAMAAAEFHHFEKLRDRLVELGEDPAGAMEPFVAALEEFHARTAPNDWLEGLIKAYVGDGIATDFYREVSALVDPRTRSFSKWWNSAAAIAASSALSMIPGANLASSASRSNAISSPNASTPSRSTTAAR